MTNGTRQPLYLEESGYDLLMMDYACGKIDRALRLVVDSHLALSATARREAALLDCVGGALIEDECGAAAMSLGSLQNVLARLETLPPASCARKHSPGVIDDLPLPPALCRYVREMMGDRPLRWQTVGWGLKVLPLPGVCARRRAFIVRALPGAALPRHRHAATEITLVLRGGYRDEYNVYGPGDLAVMEAGSAHRPVIDPEQGCEALVLSGAAPGVRGWFNLVITRRA